VFFRYDAGDFYEHLLHQAGIESRVHQKTSRYSPGPIRELRRRMKQEQYDLVLSFLTIPNLYCLLARIGLRRPPKVVVSERNCLATGYNWKNRLAERFYPLADAVTVNSHHMRQLYQRRYPHLGSRLHTIWNGVLLDRFPAADMVDRSDGVRLLAIGRMVEYKNWLCAVRALRIVRDEYRLNVRIDWFGRLHRLTLDESSYLDQMRREIEANGLEEDFRLLGEDKQVAALHAARHALIHPSYAEGLPNVVCEALACGRPAILSNLFDHPRLIHESTTGLLFDPHDPRSLAESIRRFCDFDDSQLLAMSRQAREFAETNLSVVQMGNRYERLFQELLGGHSATASTNEAVEVQSGAPAV